MASTTHNPPAPVVSSKTSAPHPFAPLTAAEIANAANLVRAAWPQGTDLKFKAVTLEEPEKKEGVAFLQAESEGKSVTPPARRAFCSYHLRNTDKLHEAIANLSEQKIDSNFRIDEGLHAPLDVEEILGAEQSALENETVKAEIAKLNLPEGSVVVCDPWPYGSDGIGDDKRLIQCFLYMRAVENSSEPDSNHYAIPLPISPVINTSTRELVRIDYLPTGTDFKASTPKPWAKRPGNEYIPEHQKLRTDLKPLHVVQPEGASFTVKEEGNSSQVLWQKWSFRVSFNQREGPILYDVRYDGRPLFYRIALSDMNIPYADPRHPYHKKSAFDLGDAGAGNMANNLGLGCDCLGSIHYLSATLSTHTGESSESPNVVCIHEQDSGIGWKHTNYRTARAALVRNRELVVQSVITVANYEYIFAYIFNQAAELHYEVRASGILSTQPVDDGVQVPYGTIVHPGVLAVHHQHIFSLRIDPQIDGQENRLVYSDALAMPLDAETNPHGNGYIVKETLVEKAGGFDAPIEKNRTFKIQHATNRNPINGNRVGYKILLPPFQKILSHPDSFNYKRAEFSNHSVYALPYAPDQLFSGGKYTNQSRGGRGVRAWCEQSAHNGESMVDKDIVVFLQFGINHVPRIEDFPVMPVEIVRVMLKPVNFFDKNPSLDVPPSTQSFNQSTLLSAGHRQGTAELSVNGGACHTNGVNGANGANGAH